MALSRKFLAALGIDAEKIDEIINAHSDTVEALKEERDSFREKAEKYDKAQKDLDDANKKIESLSKDDAYKIKYEAIKEDFDSYRKGVEAEKVKTSKSAAYKNLLKEIGIADKRIDAVAKLMDLEKITLDKDGKIEGSDDLKKSLSEEWSDFIVTEGKQGAGTATPPGAVKTTMTRDQIVAIKDPVERRQAIAQNMNLFNGGK